MQDLEIAKKQLYSQRLTLAIVKNGHILFQTDSHRISGFLQAIEQLGTELDGASVADRVAGKALALLCVYARTKEVYAVILSKEARGIFENNRISISWDQLVENVLDANKAEVCPFEKVAADIADPKDAYDAFKALLTKKKACN